MNVLLNKRVGIFALLLIFSIQLFSQINIVSGLDGEVYNQFANDIKNNTKVNVKVYTSNGSVSNMLLLQSDSIQLAFTQYDVLNSFGIDNPEIKEKIKVFLPLYNEEIQLVSLKSSNIKDITDLLGKRVGMGGENSGSNFTANYIKSMSGIEWKDVILPFASSIDALINSEVDAFFFVGAAPSYLLMGLPESIKAQLTLVPVSISNKKNSCYAKKIISAGTYPWQTEDVKSYTVRSLIIVNTQHINSRIALQMDSLYYDLKNNLNGIQLNKYSHPKWKSVEFSDMNGVNWPVYKEEYTMKEKVLDSIGWLAALLSFIQIYFIINKLWKRKHEIIVAESISISAMFISLFINLFFAIKNISVGGYAQLSGNFLWIIASTVSLLVGMGLYVHVNKGTGFFRLLLKALNMERKEAGDLAKRFFQPSSADKIIDILGRLAMIDNDLDEKEKQYIQKFADNWHIKIDWDAVRKYADDSGNKYNKLRKSLQVYLKSSPPKELATHLIDVISLLINADGKVTKEEALMESELTGIIKKYLGEEDEVDFFKVAVVPQNADQDNAIRSRFPELERVEIAGGFAYLTEGFYSEDYAEEVSMQYRAFNVFSVVFKPNMINKFEDLGEIIDKENKGSTE
jgi:TRAP transporter TAXI family solute receptor